MLTVWDPEHFQGDAAEMLRRLPGADAGAVRRRRGSAGSHVIVDAVLGTGFSGAPREPADGAIEAINDARARVVACDVPSGVDASTGEVEGVAVRAVATATFHRAKPGLWIHPGKALRRRGPRDRHRDPAAASPVGAEAGLIGGGVLRDMPRRGSDSTKFSSGNVFILGGSTRAHRRAVDVRAGRDAHRRGLRHRRRARIASSSRSR